MKTKELGKKLKYVGNSKYYINGAIYTIVGAYLKGYDNSNTLKIWGPNGVGIDGKKYINDLQFDVEFEEYEPITLYAYEIVGDLSIMQLGEIVWYKSLRPEGHKYCDKFDLKRVPKLDKEFN